MKKLVVLVGAALGIAWFVKQKKAAEAAKPADTWAESSDPV